MIEAVERKNVAETVYRKMLDMVIDGEWKKGEMIPSENELCEAFSVSRNTIRQAIHRMSALGILTSVQGKGTFVQEIDSSFFLNKMVPSVFLGEKDCISVLQFMKAIQVESVRLVCKNSKENHVSKLADCIKQMKSTTDIVEFFEHDMAYHFYLAELTENGLFTKSMDIAVKLLHVYLKNIVAVHGGGKSIEQHEACYNAILEHDVERAVRSIETHYDMLLDRMVKWLESEQI